MKVTKKLELAHSGSKPMAHLWHTCSAKFPRALIAIPQTLPNGWADLGASVEDSPVAEADAEDLSQASGEMIIPLDLLQPVQSSLGVIRYQCPRELTVCSDTERANLPFALEKWLGEVAAKVKRRYNQARVPEMATYFQAHKAVKVFTEYKRLIQAYWEAQPKPGEHTWISAFNVLIGIEA